MLTESSTLLKQLKKKSPCSVKEVTKDIEYFTGWYLHLSGFSSPDGRIEINKKMPIFEKEGTLTHEIGHARCTKRECECYGEMNHTLIEVHAELFTLHFLLKRGKINAIEARFDRLQNDWCNGCHRKAKAIIKKRRIYKRCQEFVENYDLLS